MHQIQEKQDLDAYAKEKFGADYKTKYNVKSLKWGSQMPKKGIATDGGLAKYNSKDELIYVGKQAVGGVTIGGNSIYISDTFASYPSMFLESTIGHEFVHSYQHMKFGSNYNSSYSEFAAYQYSIEFSRCNLSSDTGYLKAMQDFQKGYTRSNSYHYSNIPGFKIP
jgi:hypothetical protein